MANTTIYQDIAKRTGGDIYLGVVGPVRTGKSTFIKKFMESAVIPMISDGNDRTRAIDELPQSGSGRTVMTTEPKFVPDEAVRITAGDSTDLRVRLVDCVGYLVPGALGEQEEGEERMVHTPWSEEPLPFRQAAELGTHKVITEHSTIAVLVTTDGTIGDIPRSAYTEAEERVAHELTASGKPFAVILNSAYPGSEEAIGLAYELERKYRAPVALVNCTEINGEDVSHILELILGQFPVRELLFRIPKWGASLPEEHPLRESIRKFVDTMAGDITRMGDIRAALAKEETGENIRSCTLDGINAGEGTAVLDVTLLPELYFRVLSELTGMEIPDDAALFSAMRELSQIREAYDKVATALREVETGGYGIVMPGIDDLHLEEPKIIKQSGGYGVKLKASAPSIHMIRADIETEINPVVGTEQQSEELIRSILSGFEEDPRSLWESNMFGKPLYELVNDGLRSKLAHMPEESRGRLGKTLERIINEGSGGLICILL